MRHSLFVCTGCMAIAALTISLSLQALQAPASSQAKSLAASDAAAEAQANLDKAVQNPAASLISVPFQNNYLVHGQFGDSPGSETNFSSILYCSSVNKRLVHDLAANRHRQLEGFPAAACGPCRSAWELAG